MNFVPNLCYKSACELYAYPSDVTMLEYNFFMVQIKKDAITEVNRGKCTFLFENEKILYGTNDNY